MGGSRRSRESSLHQAPLFAPPFTRRQYAPQKGSRCSLRRHPCRGRDSRDRGVRTPQKHRYATRPPPLPSSSSPFSPTRMDADGALITCAVARLAKASVSLRRRDTGTRRTRDGLPTKGQRGAELTPRLFPPRFLQKSSCKRSSLSRSSKARPSSSTTSPPCTPPPFSRFVPR